MNFVLTGSFWAAKRNASLATFIGTPPISNKTCKEANFPEQPLLESLKEALRYVGIH